MQPPYGDYQIECSETELGNGKVKVNNQRPVMKIEEKQKAEKAIKEALFEIFSKYM
ncbi:MAG: hypothetical protein AB9836_12160 [Aminipila sp.]